MDAKAKYIEKYKELRLSLIGKPLHKDFLKFAGITSIRLETEFGENPYSKLQKQCGDKPNKLEMVRTPTQQIFEQYGSLVKQSLLDKERRPPRACQWRQARYRPTPEGLSKIHGLKWSQMRFAFIEHFGRNGEWKKEVEFLTSLSGGQKKRRDKTFEQLIERICAWRPDRKRRVEESYQVELKNYLKRFFNDVIENCGGSNCDILVNRRYPIELKKNPSLSNYDRFLGQMIRHENTFGSVIGIVTSISSRDRFINFKKLFDVVKEKYGLNGDLFDK